MACSHEKQKDVGVAFKEKAPKSGCWAFVWVTVICSADKQYLAFLFSECRPLCSFQEFESAPCAGKTDRKCTGTSKWVNCAVTPDAGIVPLGLSIKYTHLPPPPGAVFWKFKPKNGISEGCSTEDQTFWGGVVEKPKKLKKSIRTHHSHFLKEYVFSNSFFWALWGENKHFSES